jgi:hypothetical protein
LTGTPYFSGVERDPSHRERARKIALTLAKSKPELGYGLLYSAASYLLRDGQQLRDSTVLAEARRRKDHVDRAVETRRKRLASRSRDEDESAFAKVAEGGS